MDLIVCPAAALADICRRHGPSHVITIVSPREKPTALTCSADRLTLFFNDIVAAQPGLVAPDAAAVEAIIRFGLTWSGDRACILQCGFGVSRSPAAAYIIGCLRCPDVPEQELAASLRAASPLATPNALMVSLADELLGRSGRMIAAIEIIGRGADYKPYSSFRLALPCPAPV